MGYLISVPADFNDVSIVLLCFFDVFCYILMGYLISVPGVPNKTVPVGYPIKRTPYLIKRTHGYLITVPVGSFIRYFRVRTGGLRAGGLRGTNLYHPFRYENHIQSYLW